MLYPQRDHHEIAFLIVFVPRETGPESVDSGIPPGQAMFEASDNVCLGYIFGNIFERQRPGVEREHFLSPLQQ